MAQTINVFSQTAPTFGNLDTWLNENFDTIKSNFSGTTFPTNPTTGQPCFRTDLGETVVGGGTTGKLYIYSGNVNAGALGNGWVTIVEMDPIYQEVINSRGTKNTLDQRLDIAMNEDGTLKAGALTGVLSEWLEAPTLTFTYLTSTTFKTNGNTTDIFLTDRRVKIVQTSTDDIFTDVVSATYDGGQDETTVTVTATTLVMDNTLTDVQYGIVTPYNGESGGSYKPPAGVQTTTPSVTASATMTEGETLQLAVLNNSTALNYSPVGTNVTASYSSPNIELSNPTSGSVSFVVTAENPDLTNDVSLPYSSGTISVKLATPVLTPPADTNINTDVTYTYTVSDNSDTFVLNLGTTDYTYVSTTASLVSDSAGVVTVNGITGTPVSIVVQFTVAATYSSVNGTSSDSAGNWTTSATSANDSIIIGSGAVVQNEFYTALYEDSGGTNVVTVPNSVISTGIDAVLYKGRDSASDWIFSDSVRGDNARLATNLTSAENAGGGAFNMGASESSVSIPTYISGERMVAYTFSLPTDNSYTTENGATIASTTKSNSFMSAFSYVASGTTGKVNVGLPDYELVVLKRRDTIADWGVLHKDITPLTNALFLNTTASQFPHGGWIQGTFGTVPTIEVVGATSFNVAAENNIGYAFKSVAGKCKVGSYTGTGDNTLSVSTGFDTDFLMIKRTDAVGEWVMIDNPRGQDWLWANLSDAEYTAGSDYIVLGADGFSGGTLAGSSTNANGGTYIYLAIAKPTYSQKFDTELYTGNGTTQNIPMTNITEGVDFSWIKDRTSGTAFHVLTDSVRGINSSLFSNSTNAESTDTDLVTALNASSISVGGSGWVNFNADSIVSWNFSCPNDEPTNNDGSITSNVKFNDFMSIVSYTGTGALATVGHGLSTAPQLVIFKNRDGVENWPIYNKTIGATNYLQLNTTIASTATATLFNNTEPTSSIFTVNTNTSVNANTQSIIAYCFTSIAGKCKVGSYTGNGTTTNAIHCGFKPKFIMIKRTDSTGNWIMLDAERGIVAGNDNYLFANTSGAENPQGLDDVADVTNDGFDIKAVWAEVNASGGTYIFLAIAEGA